jgi:hypothetical protein
MKESRGDHPDFKLNEGLLLSPTQPMYVGILALACGAEVGPAT